MLMSTGKVDVGSRDEDQRTPLHLAAVKDQLEVVRVLVEEYGADVNLRDDTNTTPLKLAKKVAKDSGGQKNRVLKYFLTSDKVSLKDPPQPTSYKKLVPDIHTLILAKKLNKAKPTVLHELIQNQFLPIVESLDARELVHHLFRDRRITRHELARVKSPENDSDERKV